VNRLDTITSTEDKERLHVEGPRPPKLKLNLGCGNDWMFMGTINVDCRNLIPPEGTVFVRNDITDLSNLFQDGCADELWTKDVIEHFPQGGTGKILDEWVRLLTPGGTLHLKCPDLYALANFILSSKDKDDDTKAHRVYGGQDYPENFHRAGFSIPLLTKLLQDRGMTVVKSWNQEETNLCIEAVKK